MINEQLKNYKITSLLGEGGMAKVYLAHDAKFDTNVAVKLLNVEYAHNENIRKRFLAEAKSMFRMSHPNIIKVTDLIDEQDTVAFVMEFVEGETLKEFIDRKRKLTDEEIVSVFSQMLDAVSYVHSRKLVHRDIKPSNFMVTPSGSVKLMDFGIAKNTDETSMEYTQTGTGMQMGTPMYMSPEQVTETKSVTVQSDIYSLGVVLWQMVTNQKPYDTKTLSSFQLQTKIVNDPLPKSNTPWDDIIEKATNKQEDNRFSACLSFKNALNDLSEIEQIKTVINSGEQTVVEQSMPKEKEIRSDNKTKDRINSKSTLNTKTPTKKRKWGFPAIVLFVGVLSLGIYFMFFRENYPVEIEFVEIPAGTFTMGSSGKELWHENEEKKHLVTLSAFKMSKNEITFSQYDAFCEATGRAKPNDEGWGRGSRPVINVTWEDANAFAEWMGCRLPTEAEWEYACRAGKKSPFNTGYNLTTNRANYDGNYPYSKNKKGRYLKRTQPTGSYPPNAWGLNDMHGNVWEFCSDWYYEDIVGSNNPEGPISGSHRVMRGGSWYSDAKDCRSARRFSIVPDEYNNVFGFRVVVNDQKVNKIEKVEKEYDVKKNNITDRSGNTYHVVKIGEQYWIKENLTVNKFRNGDIIPEVKTNDEWCLAGENNQPAWCYYENNKNNGKKYGKLYNWYAVNDPRGLAPEGWHVPSNKEWDQLIKTVGGESVAGKRLKSNQGWAEEGNGWDEVGFTGLPAGYRYGLIYPKHTGNYYDVDQDGYWWSSSVYSSRTYNAWYRYLSSGSDNSGSYSYGFKENGLSVRCVRD